MAWPRLAAAVEPNTCGRGKVVGQTSILDQGQFVSSRTCATASSIRQICVSYTYRDEPVITT